MNNRQYLNNMIAGLVIAGKIRLGTKLGDEIDHFMNGVDDREYDYEYADAIFDLEERNEGKDGDKTLLKQARELLITAGYYRITTREELDSIISNRPGKVQPAFKYQGRLYDCDWSMEAWLKLPHGTKEPWQQAGA